MRHRYRLPFACSIFALTLVVLFSHAIFTKKIILVSNMRTSNPFLSIKGASPFPIEPFDTVNQFLPWFHFDRESIRDLSLPLWNPYNGCGAPHIANMQSALFYPLNAFVYLLNWKWGLLLLYFFKFFLIGLFSYLYLTEIGTDYRAAIVASIAAMYSGFMYMFEFQMTGAAFCFFLGLWALELIIKYPDRFKGYALLLIAFVIAVFTGHPEILFFMTFVLGLYFLIRLSAGPRDGGKPHGVPPYTILLKAGIVICIGILISAIQLLPFIQYLHASTVFVSRASGTTAPFYPFSVLLPAIGNFFGKNMITINTSANWINAGLNYVGIVFFLFGVAGIAGLFRERLTKAYTALFVVTMIIPFNVPLLHNVLAAIPGFDVAEKSHLLIFSGYMLILIGAKYLDALLNGKCNLKTLYVAVYITISLILALYLISGTYYRLNTALVYMVLIMMIAVIFIIKIKNKDVVAALLGIMTFLPAVMGTISASLLDRSSFFPTNTIIDTIRRDTSVFRVLPLMKDGIKSWEPDLNTFYAIEDPRSYDTMGVRWYDTFVLKLLTEPGIIDFLNVKYLISPGAPVLAEASAYRSRISEPVFKENNTIRTYLNRFSFDVDMPVSAFQPVVSANGFTLYENPNALNRAFMVYDYKVADTHQRAFELVKQYASQLSTTAVIFKGDARYASFMPDNTTTSALDNTVSFEKYTPNRIKMRVDTSSPGLLVISNTYFPGWHVSIDGKETKVMRTDYAFQGVFVPKGHHEVRLDYMPLSFVIGLILSIAGIAAIPLIYIFSFQ